MSLQDKIASIVLSPVLSGAVAGPSMLSSELWLLKPVMILVTRRAGCVICREEALGLASRHKEGTFGDINLVSVIKEVAPVSGAATDAVLGVGEFQTKYFLDYPVYLDHERSFYSALGNKNVLGQLAGGSWNPFTLWSGFKSMSARLESQKIQGNLKGKSLIQGGLIIVKTDGTVHYIYHEKTGHVLPFDEITTATSSL